jgi:hypothetical protein
LGEILTTKLSLKFAQKLFLPKLSFIALSPAEALSQRAVVGRLTRPVVLRHNQLLAPEKSIC